MKSPHLDDESLSAALDNFSTTPDEEAHLAGCPDCQARLVELASVARAVAAPVPARSRDEAEGAIQRALAATPASAAPTGATGATGATEPVDLAHRRPLRRWLGAAAAVAAAVVLVGGLTIGLTRGGKSSRTVASRSASAPSRPEPAEAAGPGVSGELNAGGGPTAAIGRDLGDQSDPKELAALITARLAGGPDAANDSGAALPRTATPPPGPPAPNTPGVPSSGEPSACLPSAAGAAGLPNMPLSAIRLIAPLRWRGQPALAFVFERQRPATGRIGLVVGTSGCTILSRLPM
jgi:hypothetical protein